jgi:hypothetical protein
MPPAPNPRWPPTTPPTTPPAITPVCELGNSENVDDGNDDGDELLVLDALGTLVAGCASADVVLDKVVVGVVAVVVDAELVVVVVVTEVGARGVSTPFVIKPMVEIVPRAVMVAD